MYSLGNPIDWIFLSRLCGTSCPNFLVRIPFSIRITSPKMLIFSPVTDLAVLSVFRRVGLFNFRQVRQLMIEILEPKSSWNLMELWKISTVTYFLKFLLTMSSDWACLILLLGFLIMLTYQHWVKLWPFLLQFLQYFFFLTGQNFLQCNLPQW